jgi:hypothetical protein
VELERIEPQDVKGKPRALHLDAADALAHLARL